MQLEGQGCKQLDVWLVVDFVPQSAATNMSRQTLDTVHTWRYHDTIWAAPPGQDHLRTEVNQLPDHGDDSLGII